MTEIPGGSAYKDRLLDFMDRLDYLRGTQKSEQLNYTVETDHDLITPKIVINSGGDCYHVAFFDSSILVICPRENKQFPPENASALDKNEYLHSAFLYLATFLDRRQDNFWEVSHP